MAFSGKWVIKGKELGKTHPLPLFLLSEAEKILFNSSAWAEFVIDQRNFLEIKNGIPVIHITPNKEKINLEKFKKEIIEGAFQFKSENFEPIKKSTSVLLIFPCSIKDKRWFRMGIPPSLLFISDSLKSYSHSVKIKKVPIESEMIPEEIENFSWIGVPLYDDLFIPVRRLICLIKERFTVKIAVGGPMATLSPLTVSVHLPEANLIVRGEAEETFGKILSLVHDPFLNIKELFKIKGFLYRDDNILISSSFSEIPFPELKHSNMDIDSIPDDELEKGLEINTSRGCPRSCIYCSSVHGKAVREIPLENIKDWLIKFKEKLQEKEVTNPDSLAININDDDILLNEDRAKKILTLIHKLGFKIWGIQTSLETIEEKRGLLDFISNPEFYIYKKPLLWLGTDSFLSGRRKRLGRKPLNKKAIEELIEMFEKKEIGNFHYLILSDHKTDWIEFIEEIIFICNLQKYYKYFGIIPTSRFLIPYPYTPSFKIIPINRIEKEILSVKSYPQFDYPIVKFVKPQNEYIYALLNSSLSFESPIFKKNFANSLSTKNFREVINILYSLLKLEIEKEKDEEKRKALKELIKNLERKGQKLILS